MKELTIITLTIILSYSIIIFLFSIAFIRQKEFSISKDIKNIQFKISVIIAMRNEAKNIGFLIQDLSKQNYPKELFEIILIDDFSEDNSIKIAEINKQKFSLSNLQIIKNEGKGKKAAIKKGIELLKGDLIVTTDADCRVSKNWLITIAHFYEKEKSDMIIAPVKLTSNNQIFTKLQSLEFTSLIASGAGAANLQIPIMCNGANLIYTKKIIEKLGENSMKNEYASGDDVFLMHSIKQAKGKISFLKSKKATVSTNAQNSLLNFWQQRKRWASKSKGYNDFHTKLIGIIVLLINSLMASLLFASFFDFYFFKLWLITYLSKTICDFPILYNACKFFNQKKLIIYIPILQIIYPFYVFSTGIAGLLSSYNWKGRTFNGK